MAGKSNRRELEYRHLDARKPAPVHLSASSAHHETIELRGSMSGDADPYRPRGSGPGACDRTCTAFAPFMRLILPLLARIPDRASPPSLWCESIVCQTSSCESARAVMVSVTGWAEAPGGVANGNASRDIRIEVMVVSITSIRLASPYHSQPVKSCGVRAGIVQPAFHQRSIGVQLKA